MSHHLTFYRYRIPFHKPFRTATGIFEMREGFLLGDHENIWSEIAPLPFFSVETTAEVFQFLKQNHRTIRDHFFRKCLYRLLDGDSSLPGLDRLPSVRFGLSMLAEQQDAQASGHPLYKHWLIKLHQDCRDVPGANMPQASAPQEAAPQEAAPQEAAPQEAINAGKKSASGYVRANAVVPLTSISKILRIIPQFRKRGYRTIKLKLPPDVNEAGRMITHLCLEYPDLRFRFDANACFSLKEAVQLFQNLNTWASENESGEKRGDMKHPSAIHNLANLDYIEEPLSDPAPSSLMQLRTFGIPVAADESVRTPQAVRKFADGISVDKWINLSKNKGMDNSVGACTDKCPDGCVDAFVIKPSLFGSFPDLLPLVATGIPVTISSSFETAAGRTLCAHLAAFFNFYHETDHGLATGHYLSSDVADFPVDPEVFLPDTPGTGLRPDITSGCLKPLFSDT